MLAVHQLGLREYRPVWQAMQQFSQTRSAITNDEIWLLEHNPVFTLGQAGKEEHILDAKGYEVVKTDRGGQVTYHGPGQLLAYVLLDLRRLKLGVKQLVCLLQTAVIELLAQFGIAAHCIKDAPGVYVNDAKIASIGLRIRNGYSYHGLALNVNMDLSPFQGINPCGFTHLRMTHMADYIPEISISHIAPDLTAYMAKKLGYTKAQVLTINHSVLGESRA